MSTSPPSIRLWVPEALTEGITLELSPEQAHYLKNVMRLTLKDEVALFNGVDGEWRATVAALGKKSSTLTIGGQLRPQQDEPDVWLLFAPIKHAHMEWLVDKSVELGVSRLLPTRTERTQLSRLNVERLLAHVIEACEQCERLTVPDMEDMLPLRQRLQDWPEDRLLLFADEQGDATPLASMLQSLPQGQKLAILIGPEGGFSAEERALIRQQPFARPIGMGPRILRADTAAAAALACVMAQHGDWQNMPAFRGHPHTKENAA